MRFLFKAAVIALFMSPLVRAADQADESKIMALENAWNQAQLQHDSAAVGNLLPDTFIYTDYDGTVTTKAQFLADLKDPAYQASLIANENVRVFTYHGAAVVAGSYHTQGKYKGPPIAPRGRLTAVCEFE